MLPNRPLRSLLLIAIAAAFSAASRASAADLVLLTGGKSDYQIVVPAKPATPEIGLCLAQVARLVQSAFHANQCDLPIAMEGKHDRARPGIFLGQTERARTAGVELSKLAGWGYVHKVVGRDLIIAGRDEPCPGKPEVTNPRRPTWDRLGTAKAAADFLRQYAGVRFLYPDLESRLSIKDAASIELLESPALEFLKMPSIAIPAALDVRRSPPLDYNIGYPPRGSFYDLANNRFPLVDTMFGGHTYQRAVPPEKYQQSHPEYFALINGQRCVDLKKRSGAVNAQYCISNPAVQELIYQDMIGCLDRGYAAVDLGQPDGFRPCQCENCERLFNTGSDWSEKLWILHRKLAERVLESRPGKKVSMMSYVLTETPPKTFKTFPANARIMLCGTNEEDIAKWQGYEVPGGFTGYVYNWCPNLGSRYTPMRTPRFVEAQVKRLCAARVQGLYRDGPGALFGLEGPVYYVMGRMFDDPDQQAKDLVREFCEAAFGKAAASIERFYDQLYHGIELYSAYLGTRAPAWTYYTIDGRRRKHLSDPFQLLGFLYTPNLLTALEKDLAQAEKTADATKVKERLALVRREFDYVKALARVIHLYHAYQIQPDLSSRNRLLDAIDARNALIATYYDPRGRKVQPLPGWALVTFPPAGHDVNHLRLAYDGYQEPFANTPLNWDTKAVRASPLPGAKQMTVAPVTGPVTLDPATWGSASAARLGGLAQATVTQATDVRALFDRANLYLCFESQLPGTPAKAPAPARDAALGQQESLDIYLAPTPGREVYYRFAVGPHPDAKFDAASGFITNAMDPRFGRDDPDWNGEWKYQTQLDLARKRWLAVVQIPFKTLGVELPRRGTFWRANFGRVHVAGPDRIERSIWSCGPDTKGMDDRNALGELLFEGTL